MEETTYKSLDVKIPDYIWHDVKRFLEARESDIALEIENFCMLDRVFQYVFKRDAKE